MSKTGLIITNLIVGIMQKLKSTHLHSWINYIFKAVATTGQVNLARIGEIQKLKRDMEIPVKQALKTSFTKELVDLLFSYPYLKIKILEENGIAKRQTASVYLQALSEKGLLHPLKMGKEVYFINHQLMKILIK